MNPLMNNKHSPQTNYARNPMQFMDSFMKNPLGALRQAGYEIPNGMNDPKQIVNHLINNGQLGGSKLGQLKNMAQTILKK